PSRTRVSVAVPALAAGTASALRRPASPLTTPSSCLPLQRLLTKGSSGGPFLSGYFNAEDRDVDAVAELLSAVPDSVRWPFQPPLIRRLISFSALQQRAKGSLAP